MAMTSRLRASGVLSRCKWGHLRSLLRSSLNRGFSSSSVPSHLERIGFIGLGNMGFHMAGNLITAGYKITVHDINYNAMQKFSEKGILTKETPYEVAETSDVVITMLPSSSNVLDVYTGQNGLLHCRSHLSPWLFIDSSTIDPQTSRMLSTNISKCLLKEKKGFADYPVMLDAPVSGGVPAAEAGTLTFMIGGLEEAYLAAKPLFLSMGKQTIYCGNTGNGAAAKICNNLAMAISMLGVSEAFVLGQHLGITASALTKIFNSSSARCWSSDHYNPVPGVMKGVPSSRNYDGGFACKLMAKDLTLAMTSAAEVGLKCPLTSEAHDIYMELCEKGYNSKDFSCVFRHFYPDWWKLKLKSGKTGSFSDLKIFGCFPCTVGAAAYLPHSAGTIDTILNNRVPCPWQRMCRSRFID